MRNSADAFNELIIGRPAKVSKPQTNGHMEGRVIEVIGSTAIVVIPEYDPTKRFGPMRFGRTSNPPQVDDVCLIAFVGAGIDRAWLISWAAQ